MGRIQNKSPEQVLFILSLAQYRIREMVLARMRTAILGFVEEFLDDESLECVCDGVRHRSRDVQRRRRGLLFLEKRLHRIDGYKSLSVLMAALMNKNVDLTKEVG